MAQKSLAARVEVLEEQMKRSVEFLDDFDKILEKRFREQAEMLDERFAGMNEQFAVVRKELGILREGMGIILKKLG